MRGKIVQPVAVGVWLAGGLCLGTGGVVLGLQCFLVQEAQRGRDGPRYGARLAMQTIAALYLATAPDVAHLLVTGVHQRIDHLRYGRARQARHVALNAVAKWVLACLSLGPALLQALALPR